MKQQGDGGVDGRATLAVRPDDADSRLALAQVKGGKFTVSYLRDFRHVMTRERAAVGCFTTLEPLPPKHRADVKMPMASCTSMGDHSTGSICGRSRSTSTNDSHRYR